MFIEHFHPCKRNANPAWLWGSWKEIEDGITGKAFNTNIRQTHCTFFSPILAFAFQFRMLPPDFNTDDHKRYWNYWFLWSSHFLTNKWSAKTFTSMWPDLKLGCCCWGCFGCCWWCWDCWYWNLKCDMQLLILKCKMRLLILNCEMWNATADTEMWNMKCDCRCLIVKRNKQLLILKCEMRLLILTFLLGKGDKVCIRKAIDQKIVMI